MDHHSGTGAFHICIIGQNLVYDWTLISRLLVRDTVTLLKRENISFSRPLMQTVNVVLYDCHNCKDIAKIIAELECLKSNLSDLYIIVINGGLAIEQIARIYQAGANDYFSEPYDTLLVAERAEFFASRSMAIRK